MLSGESAAFDMIAKNRYREFKSFDIWS